MALPINQELNQLSVRARQAADQIERGAIVTTEAVVANALALVIGKIQRILLRNLRQAIKSTREYDTPELSSPLIGVFSNPLIIQASPAGKLTLEQAALDIAGDVSDFHDAIRKARAILGVSTRGNPLKKRAKFWKEFIYAPAREGAAAPSTIRAGRKRAFRHRAKELYEETIGVRWGTALVPYWYVLNHGTNAFGQGANAYPSFGATNFILHTETEAQPILNQAIEKVNEDMENLILQEFEGFIESRRDVQIGQILREFFLDGEPFKIHITSTGQFGVSRI